MPNELMKLLAREQNFCCIFDMFHSYGIIGQNNLSMREAQKLADKIGVVSRTIYNWNSRIREGRCACTKQSSCPNLNSFQSKE